MYVYRAIKEPPQKLQAIIFLVNQQCQSSNVSLLNHWQNYSLNEILRNVSAYLYPVPSARSAAHLAQLFTN